MMEFIREKEENRKKMRLTVATGLMATVSFLTLILVVCVYQAAMSISVKVMLVAIACGVFGMGLYIAMQGERTIGYYKCKNCGEYFVPTFLAYTMGVHVLAARKLKCPACGKSGWCKKVMAKQD